MYMLVSSNALFQYNPANLNSLGVCQQWFELLG